MNTFATCCGPPPGADTFDSSAIVYADVKRWSGVLHQSDDSRVWVGKLHQDSAETRNVLVCAGNPLTAFWAPWRAAQPQRDRQPRCRWRCEVPPFLPAEKSVAAKTQSLR